MSEVGEAKNGFMPMGMDEPEPIIQLFSITTGISLKQQLLNNANKGFIKRYRFVSTAIIPLEIP